MDAADRMSAVSKVGVCAERKLRKAKKGMDAVFRPRKG
jgi:hypothetical protein